LHLVGDLFELKFQIVTCDYIKIFKNLVWAENEQVRISL